MMLTKSRVQTESPVCLYGPLAALCVTIVIGTIHAAAMMPKPPVAKVMITSVTQLMIAAAVYSPLVEPGIAAPGGMVA